MSYLCGAMPNKLFDMKWKELIKIAEAHGFQFESHGKKHDRYVNPKTGEVSWLNDTVRKKSAKA